MIRIYLSDNQSIILKALMLSIFVHGLLFWFPLVSFQKNMPRSGSQMAPLTLMRVLHKPFLFKHNKAKPSTHLTTGQTDDYDIFAKATSAKEMLENPEDRKIFFPYFQLVKSKISEASIAYSGISYGKDAGSVELDFILNSSGKVIAVNPVSQSKGMNSNMLISDAKAILMNASPFPPFPEKIDSPSIFFSITLIFSDTQGA